MVGKGTGLFYPKKKRVRETQKYVKQCDCCFSNDVTSVHVILVEVSPVT